MPEVTARVDRKTKARLEKLAKTTRRTISALTAEAVRSYIDIQEWQIAGIKHGIKEAAAQVERLRQDLIGSRDLGSDVKAA